MIEKYSLVFGCALLFTCSSLHAAKIYDQKRDGDKVTMWIECDNGKNIAVDAYDDGIYYGPNGISATDLDEVVRRACNS